MSSVELPLDWLKILKPSVWTPDCGRPIPSPLHLEIELTALCNQRCVWCIDAEYRKIGGKWGGSWDGEKLLKAVRDSKARAVSLRGGGEPTVHPEFSFIAKELKTIGVRLGLITNGILCSEPELFDWVSISLDVTSAEDYSRFKGVDRFDTVLESAKVYSKFARTRLTFVVRSGLNVEAARKIAESVGARAHFKGRMGNPPMTLDELVLADDADDELGNAGLPCYASPFISRWSFNGDVYLCCGLKDRLPPFGNLLRETFDEAWNGETHLEQLRTVRSPERCKVLCPQCRLTEYNRLLSLEILDADFV